MIFFWCPAKVKKIVDPPISIPGAKTLDLLDAILDAKFRLVESVQIDHMFSL